VANGNGFHFDFIQHNPSELSECVIGNHVRVITTEYGCLLESNRLALLTCCNHRNTWSEIGLKQFVELHSG